MTALLLVLAMAAPVETTTCECPSPETTAQRITRLTREIDAARSELRLERAAAKVNAGVERAKRRRRP